MADIKSFFKKDIGGIPVWGWGLIVVGGVVIGVFILKGKSGFSLSNLFGSNSSGQSGTSEAASTLAGQSGNGTVPVTYNNPGSGFQTTTLNGGQVPILPPGYQPITDSNGNVIGYAPTGTTSSGSNQNGNLISGTINRSNITIRSSQANTGGPYSGYDKNNTGIPIQRNPSPNGGVAGTIPYNATVPTSGSAVQGTANYGATGSSGTGSLTWYPVSYNGVTGYVSTNDVSGSGGGSDRSYMPSMFGAY